MNWKCLVITALGCESRVCKILEKILSYTVGVFHMFRQAGKYLHIRIVGNNLNLETTAGASGNSCISSWTLFYIQTETLMV